MLQTAHNSERLPVKRNKCHEREAKKNPEEWWESATEELGE